MSKVTKKAKRRFLVLTICFLTIVTILTISIGSYWTKIIDNKQEKQLLQNEYQKLLAEEKSLKSELNKLQDKDYVARYASEKFMYSKDGMTIIRILD